ncbi:unnamed protein product [Zymoseptoria tritici ST99CH_3D1]|nr:unnamed protein product [Zymoseptoria tritici ST99CH_3D1]
MKWLTMCVGPDVVTLLRSPLADALVDSKIVPALHSLLQELKKERNTSSNARLYPRLRHMLQRGCITVPSQKEMTTICARLRWAAKMYKIEQASSEKQMKEAITKARNSRTKLWARSIARTIVPTSEILNLDHPYNKSVDAAKFIKDLGENGWRGMGGYTNANPYRQVAGRIKAYNKYQDQDENVVRNGAGVVQSQKSYRLQDSPELHKWHEEILEEMKKADGDEMAFARYLKGFLIIPMHQRMIPAKYAGV